MVVLEDSYHMVCVDNDREIVAKNVLEFFDASAAGSLGMTHDDPRMTPAQMAELLSGAQADLARGDFAALYERGIPDFAWYQPGANRTSGIFRGAQGHSPACRRGAAKAWRFTAFGAPVFNAGMARRARDAAIGRAHVAGRARVRVAPRPSCWKRAGFPTSRNAKTGTLAASRCPMVRAPAERAFEAAAAASKTLRRAPDNDTLLALYSLYKQAVSAT